MNNLNELKYFLIAAQAGSFTKAAAQLGVSTSALSHSIRKLEEELKIKLINSTTHSIATTEAGEQLFIYALMGKIRPLYATLPRSKAGTHQRYEIHRHCRRAI
ncbi:LysR family transcriptional regulator [Avibacterium paragallinarum]|uniref:LysR family transcriptional regulator n=1 Tax=Avibacterium paragallinarum TaxID=728 RepID=UPI0009E4ABFE|nr:LysR family transcriptional regulator [Avibacterium paragallinarum]